MYAVPFGVLVALSLVGAALAPSLLVTSPVALIALSPLSRHLAMVAPDMPAPLYYGVASARLFVGDPLMFMIGRELGDDVIDYLAARLGRRAAGWLRRTDRFCRRYTLVFLLVWPGPMFCALAGAARMRPALFVASSLLGTFVQLTVIRAFGASFSEQIGAVRRFAEQHTLAATCVTMSLVAATLLLRRRGGDAAQGEEASTTVASAGAAADESADGRG